MEHKVTVITDYDASRLNVLLSQAEHWPDPNKDHIRLLKQKIASAQVTGQKEVPPYLVTMNSHVRVTDLGQKRNLIFWLSYPEDALFGDDKVSVLSPIGTAVLGAKVGDVVHVDNGRKKTQLRVAQLYYQPEDYEHYTL